MNCNLKRKCTKCTYWTLEIVGYEERESENAVLVNALVEHNQSIPDFKKEKDDWG